MLDNERPVQSDRCLLEQLLQELQTELQQHKLWQAERPSEAALSSTAPFAIDTLSFVQWLQFIFIEKMNHLLQLSLPLPKAMAVLPMAEEYFKAQSVDSRKITLIIAEIDQLINKGMQK